MNPMKPFYLCTVCLAVIAMLSTTLICYGDQQEESPKPQEAKYSSVTAEDLVFSPLARLAKAIEDGDAETAFEFFGFVVNRPAPIPAIKSKKDLVAYFPILFDEAFRERMRNGSFAKDWEQVGSEVIYGKGDISIFGSLAEGGDVIAVNYSSQAEQELRQKLRDEEQLSLHETLRKEPFTPKSCFLTYDGKTAGRIDEIISAQSSHFFTDDDGDINTIGPGQSYRIALYDTPVHPGDRPIAKFYASVIYEGSGGNHYYLDNKWLYAISINVVGNDDMAPVEIESRHHWSDNLGEPRKAAFIDWIDLLQTE